MNKAIFFDVDNTLVCRESHRIANSTLHAIEKLRSKNVKVAIATGRSWAMVRQEEFHKMFETIISANGSLITINDEVVYKEYMNKQLIREIITYFEAQKIPYCIHLLHESKGKLDESWVVEFSTKYNMPLSALPNNVLDVLDEYEIFQINAQIKDEDISYFKVEYPQFSFVKLIDVAEGYDIFNKQCSKGSAIKYLKSLPCDDELEYYAFGDGFNDLEMFNEVNYSIAMGNGCEALKEKASYVTDHINNDGIYKALKYFKMI